MEARYIPPRRWRDRAPARYPWRALAAAVVIVVLILLALVVGLRRQQIEESHPAVSNQLLGKHAMG